MEELKFFKFEHIEVEDSLIYLSLKRIMDVTGALVGIIVLSPVFIVIALAIKIEDPKGPIFFGHKRVGLNGELFKCWKFRSMFQNAEEMLKTLTFEQKIEFEETFKLKDDPRVTKIGNILRKTSLDELPQLFNILKGEMAIVGPRPIVVAELEKYGEYQDYLKAVKPGLTGMWQVNGRSDTSYEERVAMDMDYINRRNAFLDIYIIAMTAVKVIKREGAY